MISEIIKTLGLCSYDYVPQFTRDPGENCSFLKTERESTDQEAVRSQKALWSVAYITYLHKTILTNINIKYRYLELFIQMSILPL